MANVKINTTNTTGGYPEPVNPNTTGVLAGGIYPQNSTSNDANVGVERDGSGNLSLKDATAGTKTLTQLSQLASASVPGQMSAADYSKLAAATDANTASAIVQRDASGNFSAGTITAALSGNASTATSATSATNATNTTNVAVTNDTTTNSSFYIPFTSATSGNGAFKVSSTKLGFNPSTGALAVSSVAATSLAGALTGNASTATALSSVRSFALTGDITGTVASNLSSGWSMLTTHGSLTGASMHAAATTSANGFMSSTDKTKLDGATSTNTASAIVARDASGNFSAGVVTATGVTVASGSATADNVTVTASTSGAALRVTQTGSGNAIVVEDAANPDSTAFVVDSVGNVGIRTTLPSYDLDVQGDNSAAIAITAAGAAPTDASVNIGINDTTGDNYVRFGDGANYEQGRIRYNHDSDYMSFNTAQTEALRIDNTQQVAIGGGAPLSQFSMAKDGFATATMRGAGASAGGYTRFQRAQGTIASPTIVNNGDYVGGVVFSGYDGSAYRDNAAMYGIVGGAPGASDMPGALAFSTAADGTVTLTERMRIDAAGNVGIGTSPGSGIRLHVASDANTWIRSQSAAGIPLINCNRSSGTTASPTAVAASDELGRFDVRGYNNGDFRQAAQISVGCSTTPGASDTAIAASIGFLTSPGGTTAPALRMTIDKDGYVGVGTTSTLGNSMLNVNSGIVARTAAASGTTPYLQTYNGNASTDLKTWRIGGNSSGSLVVETVNDAYSTSANRLTITNAGVLTVPGQIESSSTGFKFPDATTQATSAGAISRITSPVTTTSTAFTDITGLTGSVNSATAYFFEAYLIWQQNNVSGGIGFAVNGPASPVTLDYTIQYQNFANDAAGTIQTVHATGYDSGYTIPTTTTAANTSYIARISGIIFTGAFSGTLALRFKSNNASYTASIRSGSWMLLRRGNT